MPKYLNYETQRSGFLKAPECTTKPLLYPVRNRYQPENITDLESVTWVYINRNPRCLKKYLFSRFGASKGNSQTTCPEKGNRTRSAAASSSG